LVRGRTKKKSVFLFLVAHRLFSTRARLTAAARATEPSRRAARVASRASSRAISRADHAAETRTPRSASSFRILDSARHITLSKKEKEVFLRGERRPLPPFIELTRFSTFRRPFLGGFPFFFEEISLFRFFSDGPGSPH
jgi:hypothetical protein